MATPMQLIMNPGELDEQVFELPEGRSTIGRARENTICLRNKRLSREHAQLERQGERVILTDRGSKNGTFFNGNRIQEHELRSGDTFKCGEVWFKLVPTSGLLSQELVPKRVQELRTKLSPGPIDELLVPETNSWEGSALKLKRSHGGPQAADKLQVLLKVSQILSSPGPINALLERILHLVFQILQVDRAAILRVDPDTGLLCPWLSRTSNSKEPPGPFYSQRIVNYVLSQSVAALFSDAWQDPRLDDAASVLQQSIRASMCAPLKPRDEVLGVLYVDNLSLANGFSEEDLEFLTAFANQAAFAMENSRLYQRLEEEAVLRNTYLRFFPPAAIRKMELSRSARLEVIETEATILFSDISNFTALSSTLPPRQVVDLLNEYFAEMSQIVFQHEGTLEKYIGDALMAVWGAPFSHPDDVDRALRAAVDMQQALLELNARWRAEGRAEIQIHVGINTGQVAAGNIGSERYLQYATIGDTTNVASRVCSAAQPGEICISEATFKGWREQPWPVTPLGPVTVKGKKEPLNLCRVEWRGTAPR